MENNTRRCDMDNEKRVFFETTLPRMEAYVGSLERFRKDGYKDSSPEMQTVAVSFLKRFDQLLQGLLTVPVLEREPWLSKAFALNDKVVAMRILVA